MGMPMQSGLEASTMRSKGLQDAFHTFDEGSEQTTPERRLVLAIILNAIADATGCGSTRSYQNTMDRDRRTALQWFEDAGQDFQHICLLAGFEPSNVRRAALEFIASGERLPNRQRRINPRHNPKPSPYGASVAQIADHAGVSQTAVRNVLTNTGNSSHNMQMRVRRAVRDLTEPEKMAA
jgi:hypothetical protein